MNSAEEHAFEVGKLVGSLSGLIDIWLDEDVDAVTGEHFYTSNVCILVRSRDHHIPDMIYTLSVDKVEER